LLYLNHQYYLEVEKLVEYYLHLLYFVELHRLRLRLQNLLEILMEYRENRHLYRHRHLLM
jgi:hypothetical protein